MKLRDHHETGNRPHPYLEGVTITDADHKALEAFPGVPEREKDNLLMAFAKHREATEAEIVAWLRGPFVPDHSDEGGCPFDKAANIIERGDYKGQNDATRPYLTKREWFAGMALAMMPKLGDTDACVKGIAHDAFLLSDAMIEAGKVKP